MEPLRPIAVLAFDQVMSLDVVGPLQVFASANVERRRHGLPPVYAPMMVAESAAPVATSAGLRMLPEQTLAQLDPASLDTLLVAGGDGVDAVCRAGTLADWIRTHARDIGRLGSVCSGALILAEAGVLDGRMATTHWSRVDDLARRFPRVAVCGDRLHTYDPAGADGDPAVFTSAGVTAGIDLALALVEADLGRSLALAVARRLVMFLKRPGGQAQFSAYLMPQIAAPQLAGLLEWIPGQLTGDLSLERLAGRVNMAPRSFCRLFAREVGMPPGRYVERVRVEAARLLLQDGTASVTAVARRCGFGHPESLRRVFHKHLAVSPQDYARRFGVHAGE